MLVRRQPETSGYVPARPERAIAPVATEDRWLLPGAAILVLLLALLCLYLNLPEDYGASRVSALYRTVYGVPGPSLTPSWFRGLHVGISAALWVVYATAVALVNRCRRVRLFWVLTVLLALVAVLIPPVVSRDVFYYGLSGDAIVRYGANPYVHPPSDFPRSALLAYSDWRDLTSPYGPIWTSVSAGVVYVAGDSPFGVALAFKLLAGACTLASALLIYHLVSRNDSSHALQAVALFAWNPVVLLEGGGNAHLDAFVALLLLAGLTLLAAKRPYIAFAMLVASALVKPTTLPVLGLYAAGRLSHGTWRARALRLVCLGLLLGGLATITYLPYWEGTATLEFLSSQRLRPAGLFPLAAFALTMPFPSLSRAAAVLASLVAMVLLGSWLVRKAYGFWTAGSDIPLVEEGVVWGTALILLACCFYTAYPWYTVPGLGLLAVAWSRRSRNTIRLYALSGVWFFLWTVGTLFLLESFR